MRSFDSTQNVAPIDDTPEDYGTSGRPATRPKSPRASPTKKMPTTKGSPRKPVRSPERGDYMAKQRALEMASDSEEEEEEEEARDEATAATRADGSAYSNVPAPGVKPLVLANEELMKLAENRMTKKKPTIVFDDDDDEDVMPTQTASQMPRRSPGSPKSPKKRQRSAEPPDEPPMSPPLGFVARTINAAAEVLGFSSPFKASALSPRFDGGVASPGAPTLMSPGTMRNVVGSIARSVLDDEDADARETRVEWGSRTGYEAKRGARRALDLGDENTSPSKRARL